MTKDLSKLDQILESRAFLRNQIEEWHKIAFLLDGSGPLNELKFLVDTDTALANLYQTLLKTK